MPQVTSQKTLGGYYVCFHLRIQRPGYLHFCASGFLCVIQLLKFRPFNINTKKVKALTLEMVVLRWSVCWVFSFSPTLNYEKLNAKIRFGIDYKPSLYASFQTEHLCLQHVGISCFPMDYTQLQLFYTLHVMDEVRHVKMSRGIDLSQPMT